MTHLPTPSPFTREDGRMTLPSTAGTGAAAARARENTAHQCTVPGCRDLRAGFSNYCQGHISVKNRFGHPTARRVPAKEYAKEMAEAAALFSKNVDTHPGIKAALQRINSLFALHEMGTRRRGVDAEFKHLKAGGVTALDVLTAAAAIRLFIARNGRACPDLRSEDFLMSIAIGRLTARPRATGSGFNAGKSYPVRATPTFLNYAGTTIREAVSLLLSHTVITLQDKAEAEVKARDEAYAAATAPLAV